VSLVGRSPKWGSDVPLGRFEVRHTMKWTRLLSGVVTIEALTCSVVRATDLDLSVASAGNNTVTVVPCGANVTYEVSGVLSNNVSLGLAGFVFDLEFSGGPMGPADAPSAQPMLNFDRPAGMTAGDRR
jgi:hypothetical protein